jgi:predicted nucleic acid-binding protein
MILLDTNLLTRMTRSHEPQAGMARAAIQTLLGRGELLVLVPQNFYEFWGVATRPLGVPPGSFSARKDGGEVGVIDAHLCLRGWNLFWGV